MESLGSGAFGPNVRVQVQALIVAMRTLMKCTVGTAVEVRLIDLAVQAVDGTKIPGKAAKDRTYDAVGLQRLLDRTEVAIAEVTLADGGYHSGPNLEACVQRGQQIVMPEDQREAMKLPYFKDRFEYDGTIDSYICPHGQRLTFRGLRRHKGEEGMRVYRATGAICRACPAFGICTRDRRWGRALWIGPHNGLIAPAPGVDGHS